MADDPKAVRKAVTQSGKPLANTPNLTFAIEELSDRVAAATETKEIRRLQDDLRMTTYQVRRLADCMATALSGDISIIPVGNNRPVSAAVLNAASSHTERVTFKLEDSNGEQHVWCSALPGHVLTGGEAVADADVAAPTLTLVSIEEGAVTVDAAFDVDSGATKTYVAAETLTAKLQTSATDDYMTLPTSPGTHTFNIIA